MEHQRALEAVELGREVMSHADLNGQAALHVTGAAPVHESVAHFGAERIGRPLRLVVDRHGVQVSVEDQPRSVVPPAEDGANGVATRQ